MFRVTILLSAGKPLEYSQVADDIAKFTKVTSRQAL